jgi:hypothetical protein
VTTSRVAVSHGSVWQEVTLDAKIDLSRVRSLRAIGPDEFLLLGTGGLVARVTLEGKFELWPLEPHAGAPVAVSELTLYDAIPDKDGAVLVGERTGASGTVGVVARASNRLVRLVVIGAPAERLRGITRVGGTLLACGAGKIVAIDKDAVVGVTQIAPGELYGIVGTEDKAFAVGAGAYAFRVNRALDAHLEEVQTTADLVAIASSGREVWAGSRRGARLLRRSDAGVWTRLTGDLGTDAGVVAIVATEREVRAVLDDATYVTGALGS